ncbi:hypothetical protein C8J56DRAFT_894861 [Mycena floridula]|nr:hypothetical protein C8J56DRAFT_894861 [Mycena floridula]
MYRVLYWTDWVPDRKTGGSVFGLCSGYRSRESEQILLISYFLGIKPTSEHLSAQAAFHRNNTQAHMDQFYIMEGHRYLMVEAWKEDESQSFGEPGGDLKTKSAAAATKAHLGSINIILNSTI